MKVFISSTYIDLADYRKKAIESLERSGFEVIKMETFGAMPEEPATACEKEIQQCDFFIGIYAHRYGFIPGSGSISITEKEFNYARDKNKKIFCFLVDTTFPWNPTFIDRSDQQLIAFKTKIQSCMVTDIFNTADDLAFKIASSLNRHFITRQGTNNTMHHGFYNTLKNSLSLEDLLEKSLKTLIEITQTDYNQIFLICTDKHNKKLCAVADDIPGHKHKYRTAIFEGIIGHAFDAGVTANIPDVNQKRNYYKAVIETRSELVVPIKSLGATIGAFNSESEKEDHYSDLLVKRVEELADDLGSLIKNFGYHPGIDIHDLPYITKNFLRGYEFSLL